MGEIGNQEHPHPAIRRAADKLELLNQHLGDKADLATCDRCGGQMVVRSTQVSPDPCRNDIRVKCDTDPSDDTRDGCGWWTRHGIPITRDEYRSEMEEREHRNVDAVNTQAPGTSQEERLRALGYLER